MLEAAKGLGKIYANGNALYSLSIIIGYWRASTGWRPRRSIVMCSWDGEEYGLIGSVEFTDLHFKELTERAVIYMNMDPGVSNQIDLTVELTRVKCRSTASTSSVLQAHPTSVKWWSRWRNRYRGPVQTMHQRQCLICGAREAMTLAPTCLLSAHWALVLITVASCRYFRFYYYHPSMTFNTFDSASEFLVWTLVSKVLMARTLLARITPTTTAFTTSISGSIPNTNSQPVWPKCSDSSSKLTAVSPLIFARHSRN